MAKVTRTRKDHCNAVSICGRNGFVITLAAPRLHNDRNASINQYLWTIRKREERITCGDAAL
jgi:hypothetical protein